MSDYFYSFEACLLNEWYDRGVSVIEACCLQRLCTRLSDEENQ